MLPSHKIPQGVREQIEEGGGEVIKDDKECNAIDDGIEDVDGIVNLGNINASADARGIVHQTPLGPPVTYQDKIKDA